MNDDVVREIELDAEPADVWEAVANPDRLSEWFGADVDGPIYPGEIATFTWPDGTKRRALVEKLAPPHVVVFRWLPTLDEPPSRVEITIDETEAGSLVRVHETRIESAVTPVPQIGFKALARI